MKLDIFAYELLSKVCLQMAQLASISYPMTWPKKKTLTVRVSILPTNLMCQLSYGKEGN